MTREEAIADIRDNIKPVVGGKSLDMAIEALKQEPCEDCISRQAVLNTLNNMDKVLDEDRTVENYKDLLKECYEVLPSVTPKIETGQWIKTDKRIKDNLYVWKVTCCGREFIADADLKSRDNYCLNCGAKIEGENKG